MKLINNFINNAKKLNVAIDSIVVEQNGKTCEKVVNNVELHQLRSCGKILIAMAYGIAIEEKMTCKMNGGGYLSVNTKVYPTLCKLVDNIPEQVKNWTIRTLLTHSTGYEKMMFKASWVKTIDEFKLLDYLFETPIKYATGTHFTYNNVEPYLLSVFFKENFDIDVADFINEKILKPLGIKNFVWKKYGNYCAAATGAFFNYKDFHKIGQLLFNFGEYNGKQIVPKNWMDEMFKAQVDCPDYYKPDRVLPKVNAGYYTWISQDGIIFRDGGDGQYIICDYKNNRLITIMSTQKEMNLVTECLRGLI